MIRIFTVCLLFCHSLEAFLYYKANLFEYSSDTTAAFLLCANFRTFTVLQGSSIYSETAAANYGDPDVFESIRTRVPAQRLGTVEEVCSFISSFTCFQTRKIACLWA